MQVKKEFYTREDVAKIFDVSVSTVDRWISLKKISPLKIGQLIRIPIPEVERLKRGE